MCGIWALLFKQQQDIGQIYKKFRKIKHRGPDRSTLVEMPNTLIGFHRLAIMDLSTNGDQPFVIEQDNKQIYAICNGEIYNYKELIAKYDIQTKSGSDCEMIPHLFVKVGMEQMLQEFIGEYALTIIVNDLTNDTVTFHIGRDEFGIRPLFYGQNNNMFNISSELKGLLKFKHPKQFPPRFYGTINYNGRTDQLSQLQLTEYHNLFPRVCRTDFTQIKKEIHDRLVEAVRCRLAADVPIGCLLSGGLDSSLVASIASRILKESGKVLQTFSIGMKGSTDEPFAKMVAEFIGSNHTHIELTEEEWLHALPSVVYATETFDITTIRASTGQLLASKKIFELTGIKTLLNGDGSDEAFFGYLYNKNAPTPFDSQHDSFRLLSDIHFFDGLRVDRGIASNGIEARVPFLDKRLIELVLSVHPDLKAPHNGIEKYLLRESFNNKDDPYLPQEVLFRQKEAFSDGVSSKENSWFTIIQNELNTYYTDDEFEKARKRYTHCPPPTKEALYYRQMFDYFFTFENDYIDMSYSNIYVLTEHEYQTMDPSTVDHTIDHVIPYYWLPRWCGNVNEPSARILNVYPNQQEA